MTKRLTFGIRAALSLSAAVLLIGSLTWRNIDDIYETALLTWIGDEAVRDIDRTDRHAVVNAIFDYLNPQVDRWMMPGFGKKPVEYLAHGSALCDQKAMLLAYLLHYQGIEARVVPLYYPDGRSDHTMMEWHDGDDWLLLDPHFGKPLNIPARLLVSLPKAELLARFPSCASATYDFYKTNYFAAISNTYRADNYRTWFHLKTKKSVPAKLLDSLITLPLAVSPQAYLEMLQSLYLRKHHRGNDPLNRYLVARHHELLGHCDDALGVYRDLTHEAIPEAWPNFDDFALNKKMLAHRMRMNLAHCRRSSSD